ncbi:MULTISPECIES: HAD-IA family hydrolase [Roseinatronobacter]|uniref:HAD-IA family hydrolase n=1 Tax=Roseinatronobacter domitianus TaxID=2940293 RepID=A0ABT0M5B1_9RHOB|nr:MULTISPECIES: HAD-IA family hydrolase [Roseibaca]MCL1630035.1 HAD-IA family hydrolase [Roseibaca domitiana]
MQLVVFDVDGTLVDSQAHILLAMEGAFSALAHPMPDRAACLAAVGLSLPEVMLRLAPDLSTADHAALVVAYKDRFHALRGAAPSQLYPGASEVLTRLAARPDVVLGIATGKSRRGIEHIITSHGWDGLFQTVQVADNHPSKPHPSMLHACLDATGVAPEHAVMVGDTEFDMQMAQAAGLLGVGVSWGYHPRARLGPRVIDDFTELEGALRMIWDEATV